MCGDQVFSEADNWYVPARLTAEMNHALDTTDTSVKGLLQRARAALDVRGRERSPLGWAASQNALGTALFLLDRTQLTTEHLDEAEACFSGALEVFQGAGLARQAQVHQAHRAHSQGESAATIPHGEDPGSSEDQVG